MAGDWVKMRSALLANPKVHAIAKAVGRDGRAGLALTTGFNGCPDEVLTRHALRHVCVTALLCVWSAANEHSDGGKLACCDLEDLDEIAGVPGFGDAMAAVGWALRDDAENCVLLPNFSEHNTTAKDRTAAERQRRHREKCHGGVTRDSHAVTVTQRREEKRREEEHIPAAPVATSEPPKRRTRSRPKDAIRWDCEHGWHGITDTDRTTWATAYPACKLEIELVRATEWLKANPTKARKSNWRKFLVGWLTRSQDRGGTIRSAGRTPEDVAKRASLERKAREFAAYQPSEYRTPKEVASLASHLKLKEEDQ